jgi:hypothetical protein
MKVRLKVKYGKFEPNTIFDTSDAVARQLVATGQADTNLLDGVEYESEQEDRHDTPMSLRTSKDGRFAYANRTEFAMLATEQAQAIAPAGVVTWASRPDAETAEPGTPLVVTDVPLTGQRSTWRRAQSMWLPESGEFIYAQSGVQGPTVVGTGSTASTEQILTTVKGGLMGPSGILEFDALTTQTQNANVKSVDVLIRQGALVSRLFSAPVTNNSVARITGRFSNRGVANSNIAQFNSSTGFGTSTSFDQTNIDTDLDFNLSIRFNLTNVGDSMKYESWSVKLRPYDYQETPKVDVVAAYYGGWKKPAEPAVAVFAGVDPWGNNNIRPQFMADYPDRWPDYGRVDEDNQEIVDKHLAQAASVGITAFAVNWYHDTILNYGADRMAASTVYPEVKFCLEWSNHFNEMDGNQTKTNYLEWVRRGAVRMSSPRYFKKGGKPVFIMFSSDSLDDVIRIGLGHATRAAYTPTKSDRDALIADLRNVISNVLNGIANGGISGTTVSVPSPANPPYIVLQTVDSGWGQVVGIDALSRYNIHEGVYPDGTRNARSFKELVLGSQQYWLRGLALAESNGKKFWVTASPGWNKKPWGGSANPLDDNVLPTEAEWRSFLRLARFWTATKPASDNIVFTTWNEFGEGHWIQPTEGIGETRLNAVKLLTNASVFDEA